MMLDGYKPPPDTRPEQPLTPRELEVLAMIVDGATSAEIANRLYRRDDGPVPRDKPPQPGDWVRDRRDSRGQPPAAVGSKSRTRH